MKQVKALTGLRGLSVLLVLTAHTPIRHIIGDFGQEAVYIFFFLSAYLLTISLEKQNIKTYISKRFWRIYPLYAILIVIWGLIIGSNIMNIIINLLFLQQTNNSFILTVSWSLIIEMQLYLLLPFIIRLLKRFGIKALVTIIITAYLFRGFNTNEYIEHVNNGSIKVVFGNILEFIDVFSVAVFISINREKIAKMKTSYVPVIVSMILFICLPKTIELLEVNRAIAVLYLIIPIYTLLISSLFIFIIQSNSLVEWIFKNRILTFFGEISYSVYLLHLPILLTMKQTSFGLLSQGLISILLIITLSYISYQLIEKKFMAYAKTYQ